MQKNVQMKKVPNRYEMTKEGLKSVPRGRGRISFISVSEKCWKRKFFDLFLADNSKLQIVVGRVYISGTTEISLSSASLWIQPPPLVQWLSPEGPRAREALLTAQSIFQLHFCASDVLLGAWSHNTGQFSCCRRLTMPWWAGPSYSQSPCLNRAADYSVYANFWSRWIKQ